MSGVLKIHFILKWNIYIIKIAFQKTDTVQNFINLTFQKITRTLLNQSDISANHQ